MRPKEYKSDENSLPHSANAERTILGAVILDNALVNQAIELLKPDDFYVRAHYHVFRAMTAMSERGQEINPILLGEELRREGVLEQVGGISFISGLSYGLPQIMGVVDYAKVIRNCSIQRRLAKIGEKIRSDALEMRGETEAILDYAERQITDLYEASESACAPLFTTFGEFMGRDFDDGEEVALHARRGELVLAQSVTNHGKSTFMRNVSVALSVGGSLRPVVSAGPARRVLLLNLEGAGGLFQRDLNIMARNLAPEQASLLEVNFFPTHAPTVDGEPLSLNKHMSKFRRVARRLGGFDVIIIDTASMAFALNNENDNAEVANRVMKPLVRLARSLNCLIVLVHHIGKARSEEGGAREHAHRGRGASSWGDFSASIFNLDADPNDHTRITLTCAKRKNGGRYEFLLRLNEKTRWLEKTNDVPKRPVTNDDLVLEAIRGLGGTMIAARKIEEALKAKVKRSTVRNCLKRLYESGKVTSPRRGCWSAVTSCPTCLALIDGWTTCTKCIGDAKSLLKFDLHAIDDDTSNGNGFHGSR